MDRIIEVKVSGSYVTCDKHTAGVQGEGNSTALRIEFDASWVGMAKTIWWWDAAGQNPTPVVLTADKLVDITQDIQTYLALIPSEALAVMGKCMFGIDGYINGKRQKSVYGQLVVQGTGTGVDIVIAEPTSSQIEQLQVQIDSMLGTLREDKLATMDAANRTAQSAQTAANNATAAGQSASVAASSRSAAQASAASAANSAAAASASAANAKASETLAAESRDYAVQAKGALEGFVGDAQDARDAAERAQREAEAARDDAVQIAGGDFATRAYVDHAAAADIDCGTF